jgi:hypothetical protein
MTVPCLHDRAFPVKSQYLCRPDSVILPVVLPKPGTHSWTLFVLHLLFPTFKNRIHTARKGEDLHYRYRFPSTLNGFHTITAASP